MLLTRSNLSFSANSINSLLFKYYKNDSDLLQSNNKLNDSLSNNIQISITIDKRYFDIQLIEPIDSKYWDQKIKLKEINIIQPHSITYLINLCRKLELNKNKKLVNIKEEYILGVTIKCVKSTLLTPKIRSVQNQNNTNNKFKFYDEWLDTFEDEAINKLEEKTSTLLPITGFIHFSVQFIKSLQNNSYKMHINNNNTKIHMQKTKSAISFPIHSNDYFYAIVPIVKVKIFFSKL